jgi:FMN phosphatase YigB (HAD superfamily)
MNRPIRHLLWDLDGTLATWKDLRIIFSVTRCYLPHLFSLGHPLKVTLAATRAYLRMLRHGTTERAGNRSTESRGSSWRDAATTVATGNSRTHPATETNDALFNRALGASLHVSPDEIAWHTRGFLEDPRLAQAISCSITAIPEALALVMEIAGTGLFRQSVATNPVMPSAFNRRRLALSGYDPALFTHISGSEFFSRQKKYPQYYAELLNILGARPEECLMIGNDLAKDLVAKALGIPFFLLETPFTRRNNPFPGYSPDWTGDYMLLRDLLLGNLP